MKAALRPGMTLGILGGGQLGRMMTAEARRMGLRVRVATEPGTDASQSLAEQTVLLAQDDAEGIERFAADCDAVTIESENWSADALERVAAKLPLHPTVELQRVAQHRVREKRYVEGIGAPVVPYFVVEDEATLAIAERESHWPAVLKTARFGYDGKGQIKVESAAQLAAAWASLGRVECVLERFLSIDLEFSVIGSRQEHGAFQAYGPLLNVHRRHILDLTVAPLRLPDDSASQAIEVTHSIMESLGVVGTLCIEFFLAGGKWYVNEMAPRPHNSGHLTIEASVASQFENHVRAVSGWPLGSSQLRQPAAMVNLLGDLWEGGEPDWNAVMEMTDVHLHLYGKQSARPGRKMGHITVLAETPMEAAQRALDARRRLVPHASEEIISYFPPQEVLAFL